MSADHGSGVDDSVLKSLWENYLDEWTGELQTDVVMALVMLAKECDHLRHRLELIDGGEPKTGNATIPICGNTEDAEDKLPKVVSEVVLPMEEISFGVVPSVCPKCGRGPKSNAERQKAYRERKKYPNPV